MHDGVGLEGDRRVDPRRGGVDDRDALEHVGDVDPVAERGRCGCELDPGVDAFGLRRIGSDVDGDGLPTIDDSANGVGEVELALGVRRRELVERGPERVRAEHVDRGVGLPDRELLRRGVGSLDNGDETARRVSHDPPVRCGCRPGRTTARSRRRPTRGGCRAGRPAALSSAAACRRRARAPRRRPRGLRGPSERRRPSRADAPAPRRPARRTTMRCRERQPPRAATGRAGAPPRAPSPPCAAQGSDGGASEAWNASGSRGLRPSRLQRVSSASAVERWLGRQDSNLGSRDQNPLPYHLATPHSRGRECTRPGRRSRQRRSRSSAARATAARSTTTTAASTTTSPATTGTSTTTSCETAAVQVTTRTSALSCSLPHAT